MPYTFFFLEKIGKEIAEFLATIQKKNCPVGNKDKKAYKKVL